MQEKAGLVIIGVIFIVLAVIVVVKYSGTPATTSSDKIQVVATLFPMYDWAKQIGGDKVEVSLLLSGGAGAHDVSFTPQIAIQLSRVDLLIMNGAGLETYLDTEELKGENRKLTILKMDAAITDGIQLNAEEQTGYPLSQLNPHIWLSPEQAIKQARLIQQTLINLDPDNAAYYTKQGDAYLADLAALDAQYASTTAGFSQKSFIAFHNAMPYVARDYGLNQIAVIEDFPGTAPSPQDIVYLHTIITETGVNVIFTEPQFSSQVAQTLSADTGAKLAEFDTLETADPEKDTYISKMTTNLTNMAVVMR
ncbi:MAG: metal ABC transporter substrate-binding protein [Patescibacteria group bacterium]